MDQAEHGLQCLRNLKIKMLINSLLSLQAQLAKLDA